MSTCLHCQQAFIPKKPTQRYCSAKCGGQAGIQKMALLRASGQDTAHGGEAAEARRASLARRRANGELLGRQLAKARSSGQTPDQRPVSPQEERPPGASVPDQPLLPSVPVPTPVVPVLPQEPSLETRDHAGYQTAVRCRALAERSLRSAARQEGADKSRTLLLAGAGCILRARHGTLYAKEGWVHDRADTPQEHVLWPGIHDVGSIIIMSEDGYVSLAAMQLAADMGIQVMLLDDRGRLTASLSNEEAATNAALRQAQYGAKISGADIPLCRDLIRRKLVGQRHILDDHKELPGRAGAIETLQQILAWFDLPNPTPFLETLDGIRQYEAQGARAYFSAMRDLPLIWKGADKPQLPPHWLTIRERVSPLTGNDARRAADPFNSMLNYAYGCLEGQTRTSLITQGFDPACGLLHADRTTRPGYLPLIYDAMEDFRPLVDERLLRFVQGTTFHLGDFRQLPSGECRLHPEMARAVVAACRLPQGQIDAAIHALAMQVLATAEQPIKPRPVRRNKQWVYS